MQRINRVELATPVQAMQTFAAASPAPTHFRTARCEEVDCRFHREGWRIPVDADTDLGRRQIQLINASGRRYTVQHDGPLTVFVFHAGQQCFAVHQVPVGRPPLYLVRGGDWRANTGLIRRHTRAEHWVENLHEDTDRVLAIVKRG